MSAALEEIAEQALKLTKQERLALANRLLGEEHDEDALAIEAVWEEEILARVQAIDDGTVAGIPYNQVIRDS